MHAEDAFVGDVFLALPFQELPYPIVSDKFQILNFAHAIARPVALIQVPQSVARKLYAFVTKIACAFITKTHFAVHPRFRLVLLDILAAMTRIMLAQIGFAYRAIHPAGSDQVFVNPVWSHENLTRFKISHLLLFIQACNGLEAPKGPKILT